MLIALALQN